MKSIFQFLIAGICALGSMALVGLMAYNEFNYKNEEFALYFGILGILGGVSFMILTQNDDNEETNPVKERTKK